MVLRRFLARDFADCGGDTVAKFGARPLVFGHQQNLFETL